jgi:hypothetical protein
MLFKISTQWQLVAAHRPKKAQPVLTKACPRTVHRRLGIASCAASARPYQQPRLLFAPPGREVLPIIELLAMWR